MKITLLLGSLIFAGGAFPSFASECQVYDARSTPAYEKMTDQNFWELDLFAPSSCEKAAPTAIANVHRRNCVAGARIQLGFDGNDNVLSPAANQPFHRSKNREGSTIFVAATALMLASRALKSR